MAIVIGASTQVSFGSTCAVSANWGFNPNTQRVYCIGSWLPDARYTTSKPEYTLSITVYAPSGLPAYDVSPTAPTGGNCASANTISATVVPAACGDTFDAITGTDWFVTGYSYTKDDATSPGQESWSMKRYATTGTNVVPPTYVFRGITEGQASGTGGPDEGQVGVRFLAGDTPVESQQGSVSAGGFGKAYTMYNAVVDNVGNGSGGDGFTGQGSASIPYTALYL
jgi:hypothetical protein